MKFLLIASLVVSTAAFANSASTTMKSSTTKRVNAPTTASEAGRAGTVNDSKVETEKEIKRSSTTSKAQNMEETDMDRDVNTTITNP